MEPETQHLCNLLQPCCLQKISTSVVLEIIIAFIRIMFYMIILEVLSLFFYSIISYYFPPKDHCEENKDIPISKTSELFKSSVSVLNYDFKF